MKYRRNEPCFCGSGKKYKRCHGSPTQALGNEQISDSPDEVVRSMIARQRQRQKQQGYGRPIISAVHKGFRFVAVGERLYWSREWVTFHDFLIEYIVRALGRDWGTSELGKPLEERHPILRWYSAIAQRVSKDSKATNYERMTGAEGAYLTLAYNLYLLAHNAKLEALLLKRLKNANSFHGAYYETMVAGTFIKLGFELELENEADSSESHCEFNARSPTTQRVYSIEAKTREVSGVLGKPNDKPSMHDDLAHATKNARRQVRNALEKNARYERMVFVDLNLSNERLIKSGDTNILSDVLNSLEAEKDRMVVNNAPAPSAYIYLTNAPFHYVEESSLGFHIMASAMGFKIDGFGKWPAGASIRQQGSARLRHQDAWKVLRAFTDMSVPSTFDGELPQVAFKKLNVDRLLIGHSYGVPNADGYEESGILITGTVVVSDKLAFCTFKLASGAQVLCSVPLNDIELEMYAESPTTFFGEFIDNPKLSTDPIELYIQLLDVYRDTTKEKLLEYMKGAPDVPNLAQMEREGLLEIFCEQIAAWSLKAR